jgi:hypothetical protein
MKGEASWLGGWLGEGAAFYGEPGAGHVPNPTNTESRIHDYDYDSYFNAASCVVALDVVHL